MVSVVLNLQKPFQTTTLSGRALWGERGSASIGTGSWPKGSWHRQEWDFLALITAPGFFFLIYLCAWWFLSEVEVQIRTSALKSSSSEKRLPRLCCVSMSVLLNVWQQKQKNTSQRIWYWSTQGDMKTQNPHTQSLGTGFLFSPKIIK